MYSKVASRGRSGQLFPKKSKTYSLPASLSLPEKYSAVPESLKAVNFIETVQSSERQNSRSIARVVKVHVLACRMTGLFESEKWDAWHASKGIGEKGRLCEPR